MNNLYLYVTKKEYENCLKYGIKLSEYANKTISIQTSLKKCIVAFLAPKDSDKYYDENYVCLKINTLNLRVYILNDILEYAQVETKYKLCDISNYNIGQFENPVALICTTILPENISLYNKILDVPLLADNSSELFYSKAIDELINTCNFSNRDLYKALFVMAEKSKTYEKLLEEQSLKVLMDTKNNKIYTNVTRF